MMITLFTVFFYFDVFPKKIQSECVISVQQYWSFIWVLRTVVILCVTIWKYLTIIRAFLNTEHYIPKIFQVVPIVVESLLLKIWWILQFSNETIKRLESKCWICAVCSSLSLTFGHLYQIPALIEMGGKSPKRFVISIFIENYDTTIRKLVFKAFTRATFVHLPFLQKRFFWC